MIKNTSIKSSYDNRIEAIYKRLALQQFAILLNKKYKYRKFSFHNIKIITLVQSELVLPFFENSSVGINRNFATSY